MTRTTAPRPRRLAALFAASVLGVASLTGCSAFNPPTAVEPYDAADGVNAGIGDESLDQAILLRNMLVVVPESGTGGRLLGAVVNQRDQDVAVDFAVLDAQGQPLANGKVTAKAGTITKIGPDGTEVDLAGLTAKAGTVLSLNASTPEGGATLALPVLPETGYYADAG